MRDAVGSRRFFLVPTSKMASCNDWQPRLRTFPFDFARILRIVFVLVGLTTPAKGDLNINESVVIHEATNLGYQLHEIAAYMTYVQNIKQEFETLGAWVKKKDGIKMVQEISEDIEKMMKWKIQAVQRLTETAENAMQGHVYKNDLKFPYNNAKTPNAGGLVLTRDDHFYNMSVNSNSSSIHVPTNVYNEDNDVLNAISWSEQLNTIFVSNYHFDPSLSWQYFGSSTGFLRQFPASEWRTKPEPVDMYDCRMRPWYIEAATSPKDMVILMDVSGSMTGLRNEIAKHVVFNILDTLNDDDYFTIYNFSDTTNEIIPCFNNSLVPASMENIRKFKTELNNSSRTGIANFTNALTKAFDILHRFKRENQGSMCNQAIMLITDGAPQTFEELFNTYNSPNKTVRMFTYMIGQEMANEHEVQWIACSNRGYYAHVSTIAEARDQVQHYIPVMARPLVLHQKHNVIWTSVYADVVDPKTSDYLWEKGEKKIQRKKYLDFERDYNNLQADALRREFDDQDDEDYYSNDTKDTEPLSSLSMMAAPADRSGLSDPYRVSDPDYYRLITTVAYPVFDRCNCTKEKYAHLLGVAGTDVPIEEIIKLAPPYKLGVNGYSFAITNNGYILFHPDLRHTYKHLDRDSPDPILKPDYNSVDLGEVELKLNWTEVDNNLLPMRNDTEVFMLRKRMIDREVNRTRMEVKIHLDDMRRVVTRKQEYFSSPLKDTPFSFAIVMPEGYGMHEVVGMIDLKDPKLNSNLEYTRKVTSLFEDDGNWTIHPDWVYCRYLYTNPEREEKSREMEFVDFLKSIHNRTVNLDNQHRVKPLQTNYSYAKAKKLNKSEFYCDKELVQSVVFDAHALKVVQRRVRSNKTRMVAANKMKITVVFVATRSGLTRWEDFEESGRNFIHENTRAIDELWYRRAVDYHPIDNKSFVYSVPFNAGSLNVSYVTVSYAIFLNNASHSGRPPQHGYPNFGSHAGRAPVAVVGMQIKLQNFMDLFNEVTNETCGADTMLCYLLDNNGYVVYSKCYTQIGQFYGKIDRNIMDALVQDKIYVKIKMVDYQAVCFDEVFSTDSSNFLLTPLNHLRSLFAWTWSKLLFFYFNFHLMSFERPENLVLTEPPVNKKTRPRPCDKEFDLFQLKPTRFDEQRMGHSTPRKGKLHGCTSVNATNAYSCNKSFVVHLVPYTNLVMLAVDSSCACATSGYSLDHKEIQYDEAQHCAWLGTNLYRRRPDQCVNFHEQELEIKKQCGRGMLVVPSMPFVVLFVAVARWLQDRFLSS